MIRFRPYHIHRRGGQRPLSTSKRSGRPGRFFLAAALASSACAVRHRAIGLTSYTELLALLKIEQRRTSDESRREKVLAPGSNPQQTS